MDATEGSSLCFTYGWGSIRDGVLLFQYSFLTGVLLTFSWGGVVIKSGALMAPIRYVSLVRFTYPLQTDSLFSLFHTVAEQSQNVQHKTEKKGTLTTKEL